MKLYFYKKQNLFPYFCPSIGVESGSFERFSNLLLPHHRCIIYLGQGSPFESLFLLWVIGEFLLNNHWKQTKTPLIPMKLALASMNGTMLMINTCIPNSKVKMLSPNWQLSKTVYFTANPDCELSDTDQ